ncbi:phospholipase D family protein [Aurantimonas marianensis]|uniref:Phospholipase D n=1 Tax=Aurantimonas marianensis TaxID=2920428 RepID=A0A9X2KEQ0_9HYPH|nr:phospholipase D family protein [Aurantimonas marianensis]MCP3055643.1 phospholipase D family protein [Aurantimonas marianensis]
MMQWALAVFGVLSGLGGLVLLGEWRYRRIRRDILEREGERASPRPSALRDLVETLTPDKAREAGHSGHDLLPDGPKALAARLALIEAATDTIDLQYYTWHSDLAGHLMARRVIEAAERGVHVRVLLDDLHASGTRLLVKTLASHPLVAVRIYNASITRRAYFLHWLFAFARLNRRMHNKALVVDGAVAIMGGRTLGNAYFGLAELMNFRDCDVLIAGPSAAAVATSVQKYWDSELAMPSSAFGVEERAQSAMVDRHLELLHEEISDQRAGVAKETDPEAVARAANIPSIQALLADLVWCPSSIVDDHPGIAGPDHRKVAGRIADLTAAAEETLEIESGYLIPGRDGVRRFAALVDRGVKVRVTTNSFATNDVLAAQAGYAKYRHALLDAGVAIHELKLNAPVRRVASLLHGSIAGSQAHEDIAASLHSKVMLVDGRLSMIGSFNLDPRSALDNSEVVLLVQGPEFARRTAAFLQEGRSPKVTYHVTREGRRLFWHDGHTNRKREPGITRPAAALAAVIRYMPIERLL